MAKLCWSAAATPGQAVLECCNNSFSIEFCIQNSQLSSGISFESDCQMTGTGSNLE